METKKQTRFPRFRRTPEAKATVQKAIYTRLTEAVLEETLRRRWTRGTFIQMLIKAKHGIGAGTVNDNLLKLFRWEMVNKLDIFKHLYSGFNDSHIYEATAKGKVKIGRSVHPVMAVRGSQAADTEFVQHTMMISDSMCNLEAGIVTAGHTFVSMGEILEKVVPYRTDKAKERFRTLLSVPSRFSHRFAHGIETYNAHLTPDAIFAVKRQDGSSRFILVECERKSKSYRQTLKRSSTFRKILGYNAVTKEDSHYYYGRNTFYVLFLFESEVEMENAIAKAAEVLGSSKRFLFAVQATQESLYHNPQPNPGLYTSMFKRIGLTDIKLSEVD